MQNVLTGDELALEICLLCLEGKYDHLPLTSRLCFNHIMKGIYSLVSAGLFVSLFQSSMTDKDMCVQGPGDEQKIYLNV